ncbi:MAG: RDD family protein [Gammaproteobacteria bacterium]|nr:RDD family protein [Gammaproteobacteria bacterium]MDA7996195.1 RDD family protein [Gammaproteobacteria bacterium]MDA8024789.1 RDD family protein [Gammaproteobacteria bacterium]CAJ2375961.1 MAG: Putative membrane protein/domain protein [Arenicellales bacterium IbO2]
MNEQSKNEASSAGVEVEYAGFWIRVAANLIDQVVLGVLVFLCFVVLAFIAYGLPEPLTIVALVSAVILPHLSVILFWVYRQATPGKMVMNLKIVDARNGGKPSVGQCVGRYFSYILSVLCYGLGILWIVFNKRKQGWHDKLAGTLVIKEEPRG